MVASALALPLMALSVSAAPAVAPRWGWNWNKPSREFKNYYEFFDLEGHRGSRGDTIESTLPAFARALVSGATTLEFDGGVTADGEVVIWHDESIQGEKCKDTAPVEENDPLFPYVGKQVANLTLAQIKTLDCGSQRLDDFPFQVLHPGQKLSTFQELLDFVNCADPSGSVLFNLESKINPIETNATRSVDDFVTAQHAVITKNGLVERFTYQSFDWRTLIESKKRLPALRTSALIDDTTAYAEDGGPSSWLGGVSLDDFEGEEVGEKVSRAAYSIGAQIVSPVAKAYSSKSIDPNIEGYVSFTTPAMVNAARELGLLVKPWTPNRLNIIQELVDMGVSGVITDYPYEVYRWAEEQTDLKLAPKMDKERVEKCLAKHNQLHSL